MKRLAKITKQRLATVICSILTLLLLGILLSFLSRGSRSLEKFCDTVSEEKKAGSFQPGTSPRVLHRAFIGIDRAAPADIQESTSHIKEAYGHMLDRPEDKISLEFSVTSAQSKMNEYVMTKCKT